jgi:hydrogenase maturation protein HypF
VRVKVKVTGIVQGVGFRPFVYRQAVRNHLKGYVKNKGDAGVEILLEGSRENIDNFLRDLTEKKPPIAQIHQTITQTITSHDEYPDFAIRKSSPETELSGSIIPPDVAICNECSNELRDPEDRRHDYFFITCTNCGPRYTIIERLPYDRENTTMRGFPMCRFCGKQYADPLDRRFHAQTVACPICGPKVFLINKQGKLIESRDPVREAGELISEGCILAVKGYGGFHVATATTDDAPLARLREVKHRRQKPFAIMVRDLETARTFAKVGVVEEEKLTSFTRPIVLLNKGDNYHLSDLIAPGLHNVGVMLPYTGLHYMMFDSVNDIAFVMTSANPPNQPIIKDNDEALRMLGDTVDYFLLHNRPIAHRCDDSVIRIRETKQVFIRRSRGYAPAPVLLKERSRGCVVGLGGELNNTICVLSENKAFISQHIGDVDNIETSAFLQDTTNHLIRLTNSHVEAIACDLHPKFTTTKLSSDLAERNNWQLFQVQHHHAHIAALMVEHHVEEMIGICCDGYGYGTDGEAWGGEILLCSKESSVFKRLAHLEKQPLLGGDLAARYPLRMVAGILSKKMDITEWLLDNEKHFPHGDEEIQVILHQSSKNNRVIQTTSCGRVLDAVAAMLDVCYERTYEGEPSVKLESTALEGKDVLAWNPIVKDNMLDTTQMMMEIFKSRERHCKRDLAYSAHAYLARGLAQLAIEKAQENDTRDIGFSGGVACNEILTKLIEKSVEAAGFRFFVHEAIPPGDGGLSFGQAVAVGFSQF